MVRVRAIMLGRRDGKRRGKRRRGRLNDTTNRSGLTTEDLRIIRADRNEKEVVYRVTKSLTKL